jgi:Holliday junction resolvase RusA-like endonuclease
MVKQELEYQLQTIIGKCPSKSNCYKVIKLGNHASLAKTKALSDYEKSFYLQCNQYRNQNIEGLFELKLKVYYDSNRADLDNSLKVILDCLQKVSAIKNDNNCVRILAEKFIDKTQPRIEFILTEVNN